MSDTIDNIYISNSGSYTRNSGRVFGNYPNARCNKNEAHRTYIQLNPALNANINDLIEASKKRMAVVLLVSILISIIILPC